MYILNLVPSKSIPKTPLEMWTGRKPSLQHLQIWGFPAHVLKGKMSKLETRSEVRYFIGYPKGTYGWYFYYLREQKVFVSINVVSLEDDYIMNHKPKGMIDLRETGGEPSDHLQLKEMRDRKMPHLYPFLHWYLVVVGGSSVSLIDTRDRKSVV